MDGHITLHTKPRLVTPEDSVLIKTITFAVLALLSLKSFSVLDSHGVFIYSYTVGVTKKQYF